MKLEYQKERDAEFFEACKKAIVEADGHISLTEMITKAINTPASSFFLSERIFGKIIRAKDNEAPKSKDGAERFYAIRRRYKKLKANYPNMKIETIAKNIIAYQPAPRFYISVKSGIRIYYAELKRRREKRKCL